jgi:hypothetical protein
MKVLIKPASALEVQHVEVKDDNLIVKPLFFQSKGKANVGVIEVQRDDGTVVFLGMLVVSGRDGSAIINPRTKPVPAALDGGNRSKKIS